MRLTTLVLSLSLLTAPALAGPPHNFGPDDALAVKVVRNPRLSPDGEWIAYSVTTLDLKEDSGDTDLHMVSFDGTESIQLTYSKKSESRPIWSPDGRYLGFLTSREGDKSQVWLLDRRGGEAFQLTSLKGGVSDFDWSPDGKRIVVVSHDPDPKEEEGEAAKEKKKSEPPIVVTRLQFKEDGTGYLNDLRDHLYVVDVADKKSSQITSGPYDDGDPAWSPDGSTIAFVSNRTENPDSNHNTDIFLVGAGGGEPRRLTDNPGQDGSPAWSPDGKWIASVSNLKPELMWYATDSLLLIPVAGGEKRNLTAGLDRNPRRPRFDATGTFVYFLLENSGQQNLARIPTAGGRPETLIHSDVDEYDLGRDGRLAVEISEPQLPAEIFAQAKNSKLVQVTHQNQELLKDVRLGSVEGIDFKSADGTPVAGFVVKPPDFEAGKAYPTILWIHGGPVSQFTVGFNPVWQVFAGAGYVVVSANPRGSSGYGEDFSRAIWADWGNKDFQDVMAAVDHAIELGYTDPDKLGVGGWSYGGILTNYVITKTDRFAAAISGASETNFLACYGTDHYQRDWEQELGLPWENRDLYTRLSPITSVDKIVTPTLILCGERDWNVPLNQSEQLYQSLRRLGRDTQLIIYPGQGHGIRKPSYQKDRYTRFLGWYDRLLKGEVEAAPVPEPAKGTQ